MFQNYSIHFIKLVQWFPTGEEFLPERISTHLDKEFPHFQVYMISIFFAFVFQHYFINFLPLVVVQCDAINVFSHTGVLKNPEVSGQALLKETLFIFH